MTRTVADLVVERLAAWQVPRVFGYAGDGIDPVLAALRRVGGNPEYVQPRHEEMAAFMASGHAKYTGTPGVCLSTQGPGAIHLLGGLYDAKLDRRPVVAIVGQVVSTALGSGYLQEVDLHALFKDVCAQYLQTAFSPEQVPMLLDNAFRTAIETRTPTCVILPHDVQRADAPEEIPHTHGVVPSSPVSARPRVLPDDSAVRRAVDVLRAGRKVALLVRTRRRRRAARDRAGRRPARGRRDGFPGLPLLAPHLSDAKVEKIHQGLEQETDDAGAGERVADQRGDEGHDDG
jgi:pyruvate dehydrogenase (quinone)